VLTPKKQDVLDIIEEGFALDKLREPDPEPFGNFGDFGLEN